MSDKPEEPKTDKQEEPKVDQPDEPKAEAPKEEIKQAETPQTDPKPEDVEKAKGDGTAEMEFKEEPKPEVTKAEELKDDAAKPEDPKADDAKPEEPAKEEPKTDDAKPEEPAKEEAQAEDKPTEETKDDKPAEEATDDKPKEEAKEGEAPAEETKEEKAEEKKETKPAEENKAKDAEDKDDEEAEGEGKDKEEEVATMGKDEYYPDDYKDKDLPDSSIPKKYSRFHGSYGMESYKRFNIHLIEPNMLLFANGNTYEFYDIKEKTRDIKFGKDTDGIGSVAVHPSRKYFAVAEKGTMPNIYIYDYPDLKLYRICKGGTEKAYSHIEFSNNGNKLVSVGSNPDYTLTVWNWKDQRVILKSKAFSQEVYRASFSPYTDGVLVTSGMGHIKFWKMANTFTGLKLKGELGKYGKLELSDVTGFRELPDGKVVSGTEYGTMILWEGRNIKAHLVQSHDYDKDTFAPLHEGFLEIVILEKEEFITAGEDGYIKFWNFQDIDSAEFSEETMDVEIKPTREIHVKHDDGSPAYINQMIKEGDRWILGDARGKIWEINLDTEEKFEIMSYHSGEIKDLGICENKNVAITVGADGVTKCWDFVNEKMMFSREFPGQGLSFDWLPYDETNKGRIIACGYSTGVARIFSIESDGFKLLNSVKALDSPMIKVKYSPDRSLLACAGKDGNIFFFELFPDKFDKLEPICMHQVEAEINDCVWNTTGTKFLVACKNGRVYEVSKPDKSKIDTKETFLVELNSRFWQIKMMEFQMKKNQKKDEAELEKIKRMKLLGELPMEDEEEEDEDWDPEPINTIRYTPESQDRFVVTANGLFLGYYYICSFESERPLKAVDMPKNIPCTYFNYSLSVDFIIAGLTNGSYLIWSTENENKYIEIKAHDGHRGAIRAVKMNQKENYVLSVGADGLLNVQNINREAIKMYAQALVPGEDVQFITEMDGFETLETEVPLKAREEESDDITDPEALSIQEQKLRTEEYWRMKKAEEHKADIRNKVNQLREEFLKLDKINLNEDIRIRLTEDDFNIDPEYFRLLETNIEEQRETTKKEVAWGIEMKKVALDKFRSIFFNSLEYDRFTVQAIKSDSFVSTFRVKKMSPELEESVRRFKEMIEKEYQPQSGSDDDIQSEGSSDKNEDLKQDKGHAKSKANQNQFQPQNQNAKKKSEAELKREERTLARKTRKEELERHEKEENNRNIEDPEDTKKLDEAKNSYGDYKLKMAGDYIVPEKERVNAEKKKQQMILLENSIYNLKCDFNKKLEELKLVRKTSIIELAKEKNSRLVEINRELGIEEELFFPSINEELEYPENQYNVNMEDIIQFAHKKAKEAKTVGKSSMFGSKKDDNVKSEAQLVAEEFEKEYREEQKKKNSVKTTPKPPAFKDRVPKQPNNETDLDIEMRKIRQIELEYEKQQIENVMNNAIESFDLEISELQKEKYRLESDLKQAEMKLITFYEELIILNGMESEDQRLTKQLAECRKRKAKILKEISDISKDLKKQNQEIQTIKDKEDELMDRFNLLCPEGAPMREEILAFYKKIIKTRGTNRNDGGGDDQDDDDELDDDEEDEDDEDNEASYKFNQEEHKIDDIEKLRDERMELYGKRLQIEGEISELQSKCKKLEKEESQIKSELEDTEEMIQDFQKLKMDKLNQLQVSIVLKISQIQNLEKDEQEYAKWEKYREDHQEEDPNAFDNSGMGGYNSPNKINGGETGKNRGTIGNFNPEQIMTEDYRGYFLPKDLRDSTLFTREGLLKLIERQRELDQHIALNHETYKVKREERRNVKKLIEEHEKEKKIRLEEYNEKQMLRFGSLIDLDSLEVSGPSQLVLDLRNKLSRVEKDCMRRREEADAELEQTQRELTRSVKENTSLLEMIIELGQEQIRYNDMLDETKQAILEDDNNDQKKKIIQEKQDLREELQNQARKIETLKTEINLYKRKGGHIYTKVTTNRRQANLNQNE